MFSRHNRMVGVLYMLADACLAFVSFGIAHWIRAHLAMLPPLFTVALYFWIVPLGVGITVIVGLLSGIYREIREEQFSRVFFDPLRVVLVATTLLFAVTSALKLEYISRFMLGLYALVDLLAMIVFRLAAQHWAGRLRRSLAGIRHFLLVGGAAEAIEIAREIEANEDRGQTIAGFAAAGPAAALDQSRLRRTYPVYALAQVPDLLRQHVIDEVIFAVLKDELDQLEETFIACEVEGVRTRLLVSFFPHVRSKVYLERLREMPLLTFSATPENEYLLLLKRVLDLVMALILLVLLSPLLLLLAIVIRLTSAGPILYRQVRCGLGGRKFVLYKFRSMYAGADQRRDELEALNEVDGPIFKIRNDPRCTGVGRLMRKFSLDELPQLFNIVKGDMAFVGPRPPLPEEVEKYERWQRRRLRMQPGLTCLWALEGRSKLKFRRIMELDLEYIDNWSPGLDWKILLRSIPVVLLGRGAS
jgi:exopolysaccharide biosynthesis polyprenyl glycosylphosphotransferase